MGPNKTRTESKKSSLKIELKIKGMEPQQVRLIKQINYLLLQIATTENEERLFSTSAEVMRLCASMIKQSNFASKLIEHEDISYGDQALEYSMDTLNESIVAAKVVSFDN